jgi:hypothetical protein
MKPRDFLRALKVKGNRWSFEVTDRASLLRRWRQRVTKKKASIMTKAWQVLDGPQKWTQGTFARDDCGSPCVAYGPSAVQWCVIGVIQRVYNQDLDKRHQVYTRLMQGVNDPGPWNDDPKRTWNEVRDKLKELDI